MENREVKNIFGSIHKKYDLANTFISLGLERYWRRRFVGFVNCNENKVLDACCGTGISTLAVWEKTGFTSDIYGIDLSSEMLNVAKRRFSKKKIPKRHGRGNYEFIKKDITDTGFKDNLFNLITVVFGIRNTANRQKALSELWRITRPNGRLIIMEFNFPDKGFFSKIYGFYLKRIMVNIGAIISGNRSAYIHLERSIRQFPKPDEFLSMINSSGWQGANYITMSLGACIIYSAIKNNI